MSSNQQAKKKQSQGPEIQNVVATFEIKTTEAKDINLTKLSQKLQNTQYNQKRFPAVIIRKKDPKSTCLVFKTGKIIVIGSKSPADSERAANLICNDISKALDFKQQVKPQKYKINNIVASCQFDFQINLSPLNEDEKQQRNCTLEENFPGLIYKLQPEQFLDDVAQQKNNPKKKMVALVFSSGKVVFTGADNESQIEKAYKNLYDVVVKFKKLKATDAQPNQAISNPQQ